MANALQGALVAHTEVPGATPEEHEATAWGLNPGAWVAVAMLVVIGIAILMKVPSAIAKALDGKIALIRSQLAEAETLREEAETLKAEYEAKAAAADGEAKAMIERAESDARAIIEKAKVDAETLVDRRGKMAEAKIAAEERAAIDEVRALAARAATVAATELITERNDAVADKGVVDRTIAGL